MTKEFGPFDGKKEALRRYCRITMDGKFYSGRLCQVDGTLMMSTAAKAERLPDGGYVAVVEFRPATEDEQRSNRIAAIRSEISKLVGLINFGGGWKNLSGNPITAEHLAAHARLTEELQALESTEAK